MPGSWLVLFCAGYIVPPCKGLEPGEVRNSIAGSRAGVSSIPGGFFLPLFAEDAERCPIEVAFAPERGQQHNAVRNLVREVAFGELPAKEAAAEELAYRLGCATTKRSPPGLFVVLAGRRGETRRVVLWKFPADEALQAKMSAQGITISLLRDAFSRKSSYFKAAMFEGGPAQTAFWKGRVEDRQAKQRTAEVANFWVIDFLTARPAMTDSYGTRLVAKALRETLTRVESPEQWEAVDAAAVVIKSQTDRPVSIGEFANTCLPEEVRPIFIAAAGGPGIKDHIFRVDASTLDQQLRVKSIVLDNLFTVKGPTDQFNDVVHVRDTERPGVVELSLRGTITARKLGAR